MSSSQSNSVGVIALLLRWRYALLALFLLVLAVLMSEAIRGFMREVSYEQVLAAVRSVAPGAIGSALLATAVGYFALTGYDASSMRYVGARLPYRVVAKTAFIAYALSNTIGLGVLTGGAVRFRLYGAAGVDAGRVSRAIAFNAVAFGIGIGTVGSLGVLWGGASVAETVGIPPWILRAGAVVWLLIVVSLLGASALNRPLRLWRDRVVVRMPPLPLALRQLAVSAVDIIASATVLWCLLPEGSVPFTSFVGYFAIATALGVLSHVPGGLGVFEAVIMLALAGHAPSSEVAGALVLYRLIYYILPLLLALITLVVDELGRGTAAPMTRAAASLAPTLLAASMIVAGVVLLMSGVTPATPGATQWLAERVPLALVEAAHFLGSIAGLGLLLVSRGLLARSDSAWWAGMILGTAGAVLALLKGLALWETALLGVLVLALGLSRRQFGRRPGALAQPLTAGWWLAIAAILFVLVVLLFFAYRNVEYGQQLWWQFAFDAHAPRSMRVLVGLLVAVFALALWQVLRLRAPLIGLPDAVQLAAAADIVRGQASCDAQLALMGDKHLLFSASGRAFVMYGRHGRSWIALYDPVGPVDEWPPLVWRFVELARAAGARPAFYQVRPAALPSYLDAGLRPLKIGESASVSLQDFSLKGKHRASLRQAVNRAAGERLTFEVVAAEDVPALMPSLRAVSDAWLATHRAAEKGFSLGTFDERYIARQPVAVVRQDANIVAFATLMLTGLRAEASIDLMRHLPDAPRGTMDFLFAMLLSYTQAEGYERFQLGMVPLSGMARHRLAPSWHKLGGLLFAHGESFYNFQGLRAFKDKFDPIWEPRYLVSPGGVAPLLVLGDAAALIGGGLKGLFVR